LKEEKKSFSCIFISKPDPVHPVMNPLHHRQMMTPGPYFSPAICCDCDDNG